MDYSCNLPDWAGESGSLDPKAILQIGCHLISFSIHWREFNESVLCAAPVTEPYDWVYNVLSTTLVLREFVCNN